MEGVSRTKSKYSISSYLANEKQKEPSFWNDLCPHLTISNDDVSTTDKRGDGCKGITIESAEAERKRQKLISHGYSLVDEHLDPELVKRVKEGIELLHKLHLPATFVLLFDETWDLARAARTVMKQCTHSTNQFNFDILAFYIEPGMGGFSPHRDRQPEDAQSTFHTDKQAKFNTQWIALSDATTENSCLHVIPKKSDPGYIDGDTEKEDPLRRALPNKESYQHIRALPRKSGQSILFTHRIIHWGSKSDADSNHPPRIAISFVSSDPEYEAPLVNSEFFTDEKNPPFRIRLLLICAQLLIYYQRFELTKEAVKACYACCKRNEEALSETYRRKVFVEYVNAMKTTTEKPEETNGFPGVKVVVTEEDVEEDEEVAMMQEMLDAEKGGYGEFHDDFDDLDSEGEEDADVDLDEEDEDEEAVDLFGKRSLIDSKGGEDADVDFDEEDEDEEEVDLFGKRSLIDSKGEEDADVDLDEEDEDEEAVDLFGKRSLNSADEGSTKDTKKSKLA